MFFPMSNCLWALPKWWLCIWHISNHIYSFFEGNYSPDLRQLKGWSILAEIDRLLLWNVSRIICFILTYTDNHSKLRISDFNTKLIGWPNLHSLIICTCLHRSCIHFYMHTMLFTLPYSLFTYSRWWHSYWLISNLIQSSYVSNHSIHSRCLQSCIIQSKVSCTLQWRRSNIKHTHVSYCECFMHSWNFNSYRDWRSGLRYWKIGNNLFIP